MDNLKYYYAKLSCPNSDDGNKFLSLFHNPESPNKLQYKLRNIPYRLSEAKPRDIIFIIVSGDSNNKRVYFEDYPEYSDYENGLHFVGRILNLDVNIKEVLVEIIRLQKTITKEDLYFFPQFINNLGATTKGTPNQAGLFELETDTALGLIDYIYKRDLLALNDDILQSLDVNDKLFTKALEIYGSQFKEKKLTQKVFKKYTGISNKEDNQSNRNLIINSFVEWFNREDNFKISYEGLVTYNVLDSWDKIFFHNRLFKIDINDVTNSLLKIEKLVNDRDNEEWKKFSYSSSKGAPEAVIGRNNYLKFLYEFVKNPNNLLDSSYTIIIDEDFEISEFGKDCELAGLIYSELVLARFVASLATKPFVLLTGLSGSGKTKLAQAFAQWLCESKDQYCIVPVGADWINREPLLGYVNALNNREYVLPENGALELMIRANEEENRDKPHFLILDEMNLSHVERYFADFLSVMESKDKIRLHNAEENLNNNADNDFFDSVEVPNQLSWPENLFVIGTVNIDETTYMFSPKVLDRANVIEFRISSKELSDYFEASNNQLDMKMLCEEDTDVGKGAMYGKSFVTIAKNKEATKDATVLNEELKKFFEKLQEVGAEFGYRSASEIQILFKKLDDIDISYSSRPKEKIDIAIMQKLLPKLHGSRSKLVDVLSVLASFCYDRELGDKELEMVFKKPETIGVKIKYPISLEKINRMYRNVIDNGFTSYAEA